MKFGKLLPLINVLVYIFIYYYLLATNRQMDRHATSRAARFDLKM